MLKLQISSPIWLLCTFLSIGCCLTSFQQAQAVAFTDPNEVIALKSLAQKWSTDLKTSNSNTWKTPWNLTGDPCTGRAIDCTDILNPTMNPAFKCDCSFNNGNTCHVTQMKAYAIDITGKIPAELANLTYLWDLNLGQNYLTGPIPAFLGDLTAMQYLSLGINNLSGPVPKELGNLQSLISLSFASNILNGTLPPELGNLRALEKMYISSAGVSGEIPSTFRNLQKLKILWASDNQFTGGIPDFIGSWKNLTDLRLRGNAFKGPIPSSLSNLTSLTNLRVSDITSGLSSLSFLKNLKKLTTLVLRNNKISGELPSYIGEFIELQLLDLSFNNFTGGIPDSLQSLSKLTFLLLGNNSLSGKLPSQKSASLAYIYCGVMSTRDYPNIPRKRSRISQEGRTTTPSTGTPSEHQQSSQRRLSAESANRSTAEHAQTSVMDAAFLDTFCINTPTPENVGNSSGPENISGNQFGERGDNESGCHEDSNVGAEGERGCRMPRYQETEDYTPTSTYPSEVGDELPWEGNTEAMTLERCSGVKRRLENDLAVLELPLESKQSLQIVLHSLENFMDAYQKMGPTTDSFVDLMRRRKSEVMGPDKWDTVKNKVSKEDAISMFNFKEGPKRKMLKVQYFKHPHLVEHLYNKFLAAYGKLPWNDEVPHYFARHFFAEFFLQMKPDYTSLPSNYYGTGKGRTYNRKGAYRSGALPRPPQPPVPRPKGAFASLSEFQSTSEVGKEARTAIGENLESMFYGVDVGMKRQRAEIDIRATFVDKTDADLDAMSAEEVLEYAKSCRDALKKLIQNDDPNRRLFADMLNDAPAGRGVDSTSLNLDGLNRLSIPSIPSPSTWAGLSQISVGEFEVGGSSQANVEKRVHESVLGREIEIDEATRLGKDVHDESIQDDS